MKKYTTLIRDNVEYMCSTSFASRRMAPMEVAGLIVYGFGYICFRLRQTARRAVKKLVK